MTVFMVEDNDKEAAFIQKLLAPHSESIQFLGRAATVAQAREQIERLSPELVLLDVELPDGSGFDVLQAFPDRNFRVVFITGHDHYAIRALRFAAFDYLQKPVSLDDFSATLKRVLEYNEQTLSPQVGVLSSEGNYQRLAVRTRGGLEFLNVEDVRYLEGDGSYVVFHVRNGSAIMVSRLLKDYSFLTDDRTFVRCHRSYLVNTQWIKSYSGRFSHPLMLNDDTEIPVSRGRVHQVIEVLKARGWASF